MSELADWKVKLEVCHPSLGGSKGEIEILVHPSWAPIGAARFADLVDAGYFTDCRFHRVVPGFIIQWGIPADPVAYKKWGDNKIKDDPVRTSNVQQTLSFATSGPDARGSQIFVNLSNNDGLDEQGFAPFAEVLNGFAQFKTISSEVGEPATKPDQATAKEQGNRYLAKDPHDKLSYIVRAVRA